MNGLRRTIVLVHGLWMTPRSWENFQRDYERRGCEVLSPAWPRLTGDVEDVRRDPSALAGLGVLEIADHYEKIVRGLDAPPILMGHSFGGLVVQMLLDRGLGAAGVSISGVAPRGVLRLPWAALRAASPVLFNPLNYGRTVMLTLDQFRYSFANGMAGRDARDTYERLAIPGPGRPIFQVATANLNPRATTRVNFANNARAPLLLIAGEKDHQVPASMVRETYGKYRRASAVTDYREFPGRSHLIAAQPGWEEVARHALDWAEAHVSSAVGVK